MKILHRMAALGSLKTAEPGTIEGVAVPYNQFSSVIHGEQPRPFRERIKRGALTWDESTSMFVQNDRTGVPLARVGAGTLSLSDTSAGVMFKANIPTARQDVVEALARGDLDGSVSIGFIVEETEYEHFESQSIRDVTAGHIVEISLVSQGAYPQASGTFNPGD